MTEEQLVHFHHGYRARVLMGPTWRADLFSKLDREPTLTVAELARRVGSSFAVAWEAHRDWHLLARATPAD